ncbi:MAG: hypothetical protein P8Z80_08840 [Pseudolabrys sp.]
MRHVVDGADQAAVPQAQALIDDDDNPKSDDCQADEQAKGAPVGRWKVQGKHAGSLFENAEILGGSHFQMVNNCNNLPDVAG